MPDERNDKQRFNAVFRILRKLGFFAKQDFWCCMTYADFQRAARKLNITWRRTGSLGSYEYRLYYR